MDAGVITTILLVTGDKVTIQGQTADQIIEQLNAEGGGMVRFDLPHGPTYVNPAHVVRVASGPPPSAHVF